MMRLVVMLLVVQLPLDAGAHPCRPGQNRFTPVVLTPPGTQIGAGGGVVVAARSVNDPKLDISDVAAQAGWRFVAGKASSKPSIRVIAPGLAVYTPTARGTLVLQDDAQRELVKLSSIATKQKPLAAPTVTIQHPENRNRCAIASVSARVSGKPPATAIALVVFDAKTKAPRSWGQAASDPTISVFFAGMSAAPVAGTISSEVGDQVVVAWLDVTGQLSPFSKVVTVTE